MNIRDAKEEDLEALASLLLTVHRAHREAHPDTYREISRKHATEILAARLSEPETTVRVAVLGTATAGYYAASIRQAPDTPMLLPRRVFYLSELVVCTESRRQGVGRALVGDLRALAGQQGVDAIELDVGGFNPDAKAFYENVGFEVLRERMAARLVP